jgi:DNA mismatch endonuclease (patch repair protein)
MVNTPTRDTPAELALRSTLHGMGLRFRVDQAPFSDSRRRPDLVFRRAKVAVFVDGCYWHSCPRHGSVPKTNTEWWQAKLARTCARDKDTDRLFKSRGWITVRVWEHEDPASAATRIARIVRRRLTGLDAVPRTR